ncbi:TPA: restriction endonuclease subunit S [Escherichia coli]|nr:hypothetical protein [Escherichia coli]HCP8354702.1 restriction endonuclease subunit S [Escherichia coli]
MSLGYISGSLPQEWETPFLKDMVYPKQWKTISVKDLTPSGYTVYGANGKIGFYSEYTHENPTIMLTCRGATCGNIHISEPFSYINGNAMALDNQPINLIGLHFLKYALQARGLEDTISGSAQPQITRQGLEKVQVPLPPLAEQKIIAEKLDTLLAQVESTKARLEQIPQILKRFRQAVLASAINGRLTKEYRTNEFFGTQISLGELILNGPQNGLYKPSKFYGDGVKIIRIDSFYDGKILGWDELKRVNVTDVEKNRWLLQEDDILINRVNSIEYLGKCAHVKALPEDTVFESNIMRFSIDTMIISPEYLTLFLCSTAGIKELRKNAKLAVNQASINQTDVKNCKLTLPALAEQHEIVRRVEQLFAYADTIEKQVNNALARVNNLTQSILAKAFRGELTTQWRAENPDLISGENSAAALLEKIKAERAPSGGKKASRKKS